MRDADVRFHEEWLGLAQPIEGLVFSVPALADAQIAPKIRPALTAELEAHLEETDHGPALRDVRAFFETFLGYTRAGALIERENLPSDLSFYAPEGRQEIRPSFAIARTPTPAHADDDPFAQFDEALPLPLAGGGRGEGLESKAIAGSPPPQPSPASGGGGRASDPLIARGLPLPLAGGGRGEGLESASEDLIARGLPLPLAGGGRGEGLESASEDLIALVWDLTTDAGEAATAIDLDKPETSTGPWRYPPTAKLERLLRHTNIPIGFITNRRELRVLYAPAGESSAHLTFRFADLRQRAGRPLLAALELLFHASRTYGAAPEYTFEGLLRESRLRQADVTKDLAAQVFEAVEILLEGFEHAAARDVTGDRPDWLRAALEAPDDHAYQGILSVVLRLVFVLYSEDQGLVPVQHDTYAEHLSVLGLYERLAKDAGSHPESMHLRFGAYGRLIALFRAIYLGVTHGDLRLPPRRGTLFDPSAYPFLEGGLPGWTAAIALPEERAAVELPSIDDDTVYRVLHRLVVLEGQRLSYRSLDVEQIGAVYESLMGYHVVRVESPAVRLGPQRVWVETEALRAMKPADKKRFLKDTCGLSKTAQAKIDAALKSAEDAESASVALAEFASGKTNKQKNRVAAGRLVLQPGEERRRTGSHYTPRWLSEKVVQRTLEPILACLGEARTAEQILTLKICDPAMGSGAFLVAACRLLAEELVAAWDRAGELAALTEAHGDPLLHARRLVAQRCLYGVDKNAAAVELAKLSLWLVTLSRDLPFTFVDHALRHGDSLVGLDLEQIKSFSWEKKAQLETFRRALEDALDQALEHRGEILALAEREDPASQREKQRLLEYAEQAIERIRMIADACVGAFFAHDKPKAREQERKARLDLVNRLLAGDERAHEPLAAMAREIRAKHAPFHWMLEFPEVFWEERQDPLDPDAKQRAAYMEAFVGNPPFLGGTAVSSRFGGAYRDWLLSCHSGSHGNADLSAHFFLRTADLLGAHGAMGLIATNTIAQGDTRDTGLRALVERAFAIYDATASLRWPGVANVTVSIVHLAVGRPRDHIERRHLDGEIVLVINSRLGRTPERADAVKLAANAGRCFRGSDIYGQGFTLTPDERDTLAARDPRNAERIFPYLGGQEINTSPTQSHDRYVIGFGQMDLADAERWPDLIEVVRSQVKPERDKNKRELRRRYWWRFGEVAPALYEAIASLERCLVTSAISKHRVFALVPTTQVFSHNTYVFPLERWTSLAVMQSRLHTTWADLLSSGLEDRGGYRPSDCFETFPFPEPDPRAVIPALEEIGEQLYQARAKYMLETDQGLTKTYNALKDPKETDPRILELRHLHETMDRAVLAAYGWQDIEVPPFCPATDEDRAALTAFEDEVIDRLYVLNADRAREEARLGLGKKTRKLSASTKPKHQQESTRQEGLDFE